MIRPPPPPASTSAPGSAPAPPPKLTRSMNLACFTTTAVSSGEQARGRIKVMDPPGCPARSGHAAWCGPPGCTVPEGGDEMSRRLIVACVGGLLLGGAGLSADCPELVGRLPEGACPCGRRPGDYAYLPGRIRGPVRRRRFGPRCTAVGVSEVAMFACSAQWTSRSPAATRTSRGDLRAQRARPEHAVGTGRGRLQRLRVGSRSWR